MMTCKNCKGTKIKSRKNYSHGKKSKPKTTLTCKGCGSRDIEVKSNKSRNKGKKHY